MAATATIRGRFAARTRKTWDSFTDQNGATVAAGKSLVLHIVSEDGELDNVKVPGDVLDRAEQETGTLNFGDSLELAVKMDRYGVKYVSRQDQSKNVRAAS